MDQFLFYSGCFVVGFALGKAPMEWTVIGFVGFLLVLIAQALK